MRVSSDLADKIAQLIRAVGSPTYETLARDIKTTGGQTVSAGYLWQLRTGVRDNPTFHHLRVLASYFSFKLSLPITLAYFDPATPVDQPWTDKRPQPTLRPLADQDTGALVRELAARNVERISAQYGESGSAVLRDILAVMHQIATGQGAEGHGKDG